MVNSSLNDSLGLIEEVGIVSRIMLSEFRTTLTSPAKVGVFPLLVKENGIFTLSPTLGAVLTPSEVTTRSRIGGVSIV